MSKPIRRAVAHVEPKTKEESNRFSVVFPVVATLTGVLITSAFAWFSSYQTASISERNACIQRLDTQEKLLREKSDMFLTAMGKFVSYTTFPRNSTVEDLDAATSPLIDAGMVMTAYAPPKLAFSSMKIAFSVRQGALAAMHKADENTAFDTIDGSFGQWPTEFFDALAALDKERQKCK
jgi:hypothetical protein